MKTQDTPFNRTPKVHSLAKKSALFMGQFLGKLVLTLTALMALMMAVLYPIQRDYYRRVYVQESLKHAVVLASAVQGFHQANQRFPASLDDLHALPDRPVEVQAIAIGRQTGIVRVHVADAPQDEDAFDLVPSLDTAGRITHACRSVNIPDEFLPRDCTKVQAK